MASTCINNAAPTPDSSFIDSAPACPVYGRLSPSSTSLNPDLSDGSVENPELAASAVVGSPDPEGPGSKDLPDFEFRLDNLVAMLPADELFSDGKLVPLQIASARSPVEPADRIRSPKAERPCHVAEVPGSEPYGKSPKAPRCSRRWRELLGLKKQQDPKAEAQKTASSSCKGLNPSTRSFRNLLRPAKSPSSADSSLGVPLLRDLAPEAAPVSARRSLSSSSSSSGADRDEPPRLSLDSEKPTQATISLARAPPRLRLARSQCTTPEGRHQTTRAEAATPRGLSADSPRMNASGKVVFQGLERSSSSPGSFHGGGSRCHYYGGKLYRGMEQSYSANVRVAPVINVVPVGSLRVGLGQLFSPNKKERDVVSKKWNPRSGGSRSNMEKA